MDPSGTVNGHIYDKTQGAPETCPIGKLSNQVNKLDPPGPQSALSLGSWHLLSAQAQRLYGTRREDHVWLYRYMSLPQPDRTRLLPRTEQTLMLSI